MTCDAANLPASVRGQGPPALLIHGLGTSRLTWAHQIDTIARRRRSIALDLPGHGEAESPADPACYRRERVLALLEATVSAHASHTAPLLLVGHSMGGYLALALTLANRLPVEGLVLVATGPGFRDEGRLTQWNERALRSAHLYGVSDSAVTMGVIPDTLVMDRLEEITVPTLVIVGSEDHVGYRSSAGMFEQRMLRARAVTVVGGGHHVHETHASEVNGAISRFLDEWFDRGTR